MTSLNTYLTFDGNCEEAFNFYKSVFGGEFESISKFSEMPEDENYPISDAEKDRIMHVSLPIGKSVLMGSDTGGEWAAQYRRGNNFSISINADSEEDADRLYEALSKNGKQVMPMDYTFWDSYFGMLVDQFGIAWMVSFDSPERKK